jgi:hypothetical protein
LTVGLAAGVSPSPSSAQVTPEEHEKHHPGQGQKKGDGQKTEGGTGGMGGMECGMDGMGKTSPKELYPSLMSLPDLTSERREEIRRQARERMNEGIQIWKEGLSQLERAAERDDYAAMQEATAKIREGSARFDSGLAAERAVAEGKAPRAVALEWFKHEMNLSSPAPAQETSSGLFGLSWFHLFVMALLFVFAVAMLWMYFHKMRRAAALLQSLTSGAPAKPGVGTGGTAAPAPGAAAR